MNQQKGLNELEVLGHSMCSITELKTDPSKIFKRASSDNSVYVLRRNEPVGVIVSVEEYERLHRQAQGN